MMINSRLLSLPDAAGQSESRRGSDFEIVGELAAAVTLNFLSR
jgi:hypothetical protein